MVRMSATMPAMCDAGARRRSPRRAQCRNMSTAQARSSRRRVIAPLAISWSTRTRSKARARRRPSARAYAITSRASGAGYSYALWVAFCGLLPCMPRSAVSFVAPDNTLAGDVDNTTSVTRPEWPRPQHSMSIRPSTRSAFQLVKVAVLIPRSAARCFRACSHRAGVSR